MMKLLFIIADLLALFAPIVLLFMLVGCFRANYREASIYSLIAGVIGGFFLTAIIYGSIFAFYKQLTQFDHSVNLLVIWLSFFTLFSIGTFSFTSQKNKVLENSHIDLPNPSFKRDA